MDIESKKISDEIKKDLLSSIKLSDQEIQERKKELLNNLKLSDKEIEIRKKELLKDIKTTPEDIEKQKTMLARTIIYKDLSKQERAIKVMANNLFNTWLGDTEKEIVNIILSKLPKDDRVKVRNEMIEYFALTGDIKELFENFGYIKKDSWRGEVISLESITKDSIENLYYNLIDEVDYLKNENNMDNTMQDLIENIIKKYDEEIEKEEIKIKNKGMER